MAPREGDADAICNEGVSATEATPAEETEATEAAKARWRGQRHTSNSSLYQEVEAAQAKAADAAAAAKAAKEEPSRARKSAKVWQDEEEGAAESDDEMELMESCSNGSEAQEIYPSGAHSTAPQPADPEGATKKAVSHGRSSSMENEPTWATVLTAAPRESTEKTGPASTNASSRNTVDSLSPKLRRQGNSEFFATASIARDLESWRKRNKNGKKARRMTLNKPDRARLKQVVNHHIFDAVISVFLVLNAAIVGMQVNASAIVLTSGDDSVRVLLLVLSYAEFVTAIVFTVELCLRVLALRTDLCNSLSNMACTAFDTLLVVVAWLDLAVTSFMDAEDAKDMNFTRLLTMVRVLRALRLCRLVRHVPQFRIMVMMIMGSMSSLLWLCTLLLGLIFMFGIALTQGATDWRVENASRAEDPVHGLLEQEYGSLFLSMYTLFKAMTGGVSWGEPASLAIAMGPLYLFLFTFYICFTTFSVLNIVTGVFVDGAIQLADRDRVTLLERNAEAKKTIADDMRQLLEMLDEDANGLISWNEWSGRLNNPQVRSMLALLGVSCVDARDLFEILDANCDGQVSIQELVDGISKIKGTAKGFHLHIVLQRVNQIAQFLQVPEPLCFQESERRSSRFSLRSEHIIQTSVKP